MPLLTLVKVQLLVAQLCPTLCNLMDYSLPGSSVHEIMLQAMMLHFHFTSLTLIVIQIFLQCLMNLLSNSGIKDTFYYLIRIIFIFEGFPDSSISEESTCNWRRDRLPTPVFLAFPCSSAGKESACNARDLGLIPGLGRPPGVGKGYPLQYSGLEEFHGLYSSRGCKESDITEQFSL